MTGIRAGGRARRELQPPPPPWRAVADQAAPQRPARRLGRRRGRAGRATRNWRRRLHADWAVWARALLLEADGERADALETLAGCWDRCARSGLAVEYPVIGPDLVRLALAAGDAGRAREVAAAVTGVASRNEVPWITGAALRCQGLAENDAGILDAAVSACARGSRPLELALTSEDAGAAFARRGNVARAGQLPTISAVAVPVRLRL